MENSGHVQINGLNVSTEIGAEWMMEGELHFKTIGTQSLEKSSKYKSDLTLTSWHKAPPISSPRTT